MKICPKCKFDIKTSFDAHVNSCDGTGPRRRRAKRPRKGNGRLGKKWSEIISKERLAELSKLWSERSKLFTHSEETKKIISDKAKERYANGWEVKCGRAPKFNYESPVAGIIKIDGSWELKVAQYFDSIGVEWKRNKERFEYNNTIKNKISTYCPDFYVKDWDTYIEVKGYKTELDEIKWKQFKYELQIWDKSKLKELKIL